MGLWNGIKRVGRFAGHVGKAAWNATKYAATALNDWDTQSGGHVKKMALGALASGAKSIAATVAPGLSPLLNKGIDYLHEKGTASIDKRVKEFGGNSAQTISTTSGNKPAPAITNNPVKNPVSSTVGGASAASGRHQFRRAILT